MIFSDTLPIICQVYASHAKLNTSNYTLKQHQYLAIFGKQGLAILGNIWQ